MELIYDRLTDEIRETNPKSSFVLLFKCLEFLFNSKCDLLTLKSFARYLDGFIN